MKTLHEKFKEVMAPATGYTWGSIMKALGGNSSTSERLLQDAMASGILQQIAPVDGVNPSFRLHQ